MNAFKGKFYNAVTDDEKNLIISFAVSPPELYPARDCINKIKEFKRNGKELLTIGIDIARKKRSLDANAYFHVLVNEMAKVLNTSMDAVKETMVFRYGAIMRDEENNKVAIKLPASVNVYDIYKYAYWYKDVIENGIKCNCYIIYKQTHTLDSKEFSQLLDGTVSEAAELGIAVETPEQIAKMLNVWEQDNLRKTS